MFFEPFQDDFCDSYIRRVPNCLSCTDAMIPASVSIVVGHSRTCIHEDTVSDIYSIIGLYDPGIQGYHHRDGFKCWPRLYFICNSVVASFCVCPVRHASDICDCFYLSGSNFHHDCRTWFSLNFREFFNESFFCNILNFYVYCRADIYPVYRFDISHVYPTSAYFLLCSATWSPTQ